MNQILDSCESTNDLARTLALQGAPHGSWIAARRQTAGRGRQGRDWVSEEGNLFLSLVLRPPPGPHLSWLPLALAAGLVDAVESMQLMPELRIKWPNDLWLGHAKAGGILCEANLGSGQGGFVIAGIGLNCRRAPSTQIETAALGIDADEFLPRVLVHALAAVNRLFRDGPQAIRPGYERRALLQPGSPVEWLQDGSLHKGCVRGLGDAGELLVERSGTDPESVLVRLFAEDVRLRPEAASKSLA